MAKEVENVFRTLRSGLAPLCALILLAAAVNVVSARPPLAVGLTSFEAFPSDNAVRLEWHTETEVNTVAYLIKRSLGTGTPVWLDHLGDGGYILADGGPAMAADYVVTDDTVSNGSTYTYFLYELESDSSELFLDSLTVTAGVPTATPTATTTPTATPITVNVNPGTNSTATPSFGSGPSPTPTNTPVPPQQSLPTATATVRRAATSTATSSGPLPIGTSAPTMAATALVFETPTSAEDQVALEPGARSGEARASEIGDGLAEPGVALAQAEATETGAYPAPLQVPTAEDTSPYPSAGLPTPSGGRTAYPTIGDDSSSGELPVIGDRTAPTTTDAAAADDQSQAGSGRIVLWVGFIFASIVFAAAVVGSIKLFTRKRQ